MDKEQALKNRMLEQMARKAEKAGRERTAERLRYKMEPTYGWLYFLIIIIGLIVIWLMYNGTIDLTPILEKYGIYRP